jgi:CheY-like chemotaxis protein
VRIVFCFREESLDLPVTRLLLVDDDPLLGMLIGDWLGEIGCEVVGPVESVAKALVLIEAEAATLDGALLDVTLREGDSYEVADALTLRGVPYAFVTGHGVDGLAPAYRRSLVLSKPFMPEDLQKMIARLLEQKVR